MSNYYIVECMKKKELWKQRGFLRKFRNCICDFLYKDIFINYFLYKDFLEEIFVSVYVRVIIKLEMMGEMLKCLIILVGK